jgi:hypothetical protein
MGLFGLTFERRYPVFFGDDMKAMTAEEILKMQFDQQRAMQNAWPSYDHSLSYLGMDFSYQRPQKPLDERFAEFKFRLAAAVAKRASPSRT